MTDEQKNKLWRERLEQLYYVPNENRMALIRAATKVWGPVPDDLLEEACILIDPETPVKTK